MTLNPSELLKQARDSNRLSDLSTLNTALAAYSADVTGGFMGTSSVVYVSIPDTTSTCSNLGLPTLPSGWSYNCVTSTSTKLSNGRGWIPVNFGNISFGSPLSSLPVDPTNTTSSGLYYTYASGGSYILTAIPESVKQKAALASNPNISNYPGVIAMGNNLSLSPLYSNTGLVGYWNFDEGSGTVAKDGSGNGNNGTITSPAWTTGKVDKAIDFSTEIGTGITIPNSSSLNISNNLTISTWINYIASPATSNQINPLKKMTGTGDANYVWYWYSDGYAQPGATSILANMGGTWGSMTSHQSILSGGGWRHFVTTYNSVGSAKMYLDGAQVLSIPALGALATNSASLLIGSMSGGYHMAMDDLRIYNRELSAAEVMSLYNATR